MDDFLSKTYKFLRSMLTGMLIPGTSLAWDQLVDYKNFLWRLTKQFALFAAIPIPVLLICLSSGSPAHWLYSTYFIFVGAEAVILMVLAFPIIAATQVISDKFPEFAGSIRKSVQKIAAVAFWALMLAVYFYVVPVWENPSMIPLVLITAAALALGAYAGWVRLPAGSVKAIATLFLVGILVIATLAFTIPNRTRQFAGLLHKFDDEAASLPKQVKVESPDQIEFVNSNGVPQIWYYRSPTGDCELYDHEGFHRSGKPLKLAETNEERNQIIAWFRDRRQQKAQEQARQNRETSQSTERRFRETYVNDTVVSSSVTSANRIILALKNDPLDSQGDALQGLLADLLARKDKRPVTGAFKSSFYTSGLFEELWSGDQSVLERLHLHDSGPGCLLMCRASLSGASKTDFEGLVSVQGTLSLIVVNKDGRSGPWLFKASGAGGDRATATANCAKRLVEAVDVDVVFPK